MGEHLQNEYLGMSPHTWALPYITQAPNSTCHIPFETFIKHEDQCALPTYLEVSHSLLHLWTLDGWVLTLNQGILT